MNTNQNPIQRVSLLALTLLLLESVAIISIGITGITLVLLKSAHLLVWGWPVVLFPALVEFALILLYMLTRKDI